MEMYKIINQVTKLCEDNNATLVYLTVFGSELYGTQREGKSDTDIKGIFIPNIDSLITKTSKDSITFTTGNNDSKNTNEDIDIDLWSIQKFLNELLPCGDVGAMDVLFSLSNLSTILYMHPCVANIFTNPTKYFHANASHNGCTYAVNQAKKYGLKGTRLGILKNIRNHIQELEKNSPYESMNSKDVKLYLFVESIIENCYHEKYCFKDEEKGGLCILGKYHMYTISFKEFKHRINKEYETFGQRAIAAEQNNGIDYKALSHAVRALTQLKEFYTIGSVKFPLYNKDYLKEIKEGKYDWNKLNDVISYMVKDIENLIEQNKDKYHSLTRKEIRKEILDVYKRLEYLKDIPWYKGVIHTNKLTEPDPLADWSNPLYMTEIDPCIRKIIKSYLYCLSAKYNIEIIYATEGGSRAWGIQDEKSDYDVRFVYKHKKELYGKIDKSEFKETLEGCITLPNGIKVDFSGWDLVKFLHNYTDGNWNANEWIHENADYINTIYYTNQDVRSFDDIMLTTEVNYLGLWYNYKGLAKRLYESHIKTPQTLKTIMYIFKACVSKLNIESQLDKEGKIRFFSSYTSLRHSLDMMASNTSSSTSYVVLAQDLLALYYKILPYKKQWLYSHTPVSDSCFDNIRKELDQLIEICSNILHDESKKPNTVKVSSSEIQKLFDIIVTK